MEGEHDREDPVTLARQAIDAINGGDDPTLRALLAAEVEVSTGRTVKRGPDAAIAWAHKLYDHLDRRYAIEEVHPGPRESSVVGVGTVDYVWREEGAVGDSAPIALELEFADGKLRRIVVHEDPEDALAHLNG